MNFDSLFEDEPDEEPLEEGAEDEHILKGLVDSPSQTPRRPRASPKTPAAPPSRDTDRLLGQLVEPGIRKSVSKLRNFAALTYANSQLTLKEVAALPELQGVDFDTLRKWKARDRWKRLREESQNAANVAISRSMKSTLVAARVAEIKRIQSVLTLAHNALMSENAPPMKSFEGVSRVLLAGAETLEKLRSANQQAIDAEVDKPALTEEIQKITSAQWEQVAASLLEQELNTQHAQLVADSERADKENQSEESALILDVLAADVGRGENSSSP